MTEEITEIATQEQIENELEEQREDIKTKLGLDDEAFDILIKETILASYAELSIRIKPDDPIFAVILSQKKVMNYYTKIIAEALKVTPREIGNIIDQKADEFKELAATFGTLIEEFHDEFLADLQNKSLEINNSIIAAFDKFVDKKIEEIKKDMPETRLAKIERFKTNYLLDEKDASILTEEVELSDYFEEVVKVSNNPKLSSNWILTEVLRVLKHQNIDIEKFTISSENLAKIITLIDKNIISSKIAKELFEIALTDNRDPEVIVKEKGMIQVSDSSEIEKMVEEVLANNQKMIEDYKAADEGRKPRVLKGIVGQVMKLSKGKANPEIVNELIMSKLN